MKDFYRKLIPLIVAALILSSFTVVFAHGEEPVRFALSSAEGSVGDTVTVALSVSNNTIGFSGFAFCLSYDNRYLEIVSSTKLDTGDENYDNGMIAFNDYADGTVKAVYAGIEDTAYNGEILSYTFLIKEAPPEGAGTVLSLEIDFFSDVNGALTDIPLTEAGSIAIAPQESEESTLTGTFTSWNPKAVTTIRLIRNDETVDTLTVSDETGAGMREQAFTFADVQPGTYTLEFTKPGHLKYTIHNIVVDEADIELAEDPREGAQTVVLKCGDITGDGLINGADLDVLWRPENYFQRVGDPGVNTLCDLNGDGVINGADLDILWRPENYFQGVVEIK